MKILFWMFIGFDKQATSEHLLSAAIEQLCIVGHSVHIIQKNTGGPQPLIPEKLSKYSVTTDAIPFQAADKGNLIARYLTELKYIKSCKKYFSSDYDAVFIQSTTVAGFAVRAVRKKMPKTKITFNVQDIFPYNAVFGGKLKKESLVFKVLAAVQRYGCNHADHIITISEDMKDTLVADGVEASKVEVVYNWSYQDELYENVDLMPVSHMFNQNFFNVVYAGNIGVMQNVDILIEAAKLMKDDKSVWFHIIGNGVYKEKLEAKARKYGITNISFWPMQPPELAPAIYSAADVNVIPLVKDVFRTALPSKTATCFACGKPVVFAIGKESKFGQKVMNETGCPVVESDDAKELADAIKAVKQGKVECKTAEFFKKNMSISANSRKYAEIIIGD
jgi:glycosyltransferase involved in cell wall biosynthesis